MSMSMMDQAREKARRERAEKNGQPAASHPAGPKVGTPAPPPAFDRPPEAITTALLPVKAMDPVMIPRRSATGRATSRTAGASRWSIRPGPP